MNLFEIHHGYWGLLMMLIGFAGIFYSVALWLCFSLMGLGLLIFIDDAIQHAIQRNNPDYLSPLHRWFYALIRWLK